MTLKICHLISGDLWAGAEVMAFHLLNGLKTQSEIELFVIVLNEGKLTETLNSAGIAVYIIDEKKKSLPEIVRLAAKQIRQWVPHILHSHRYKENIIAYLVSLLLRDKVALVSTQHGMPEFYNASPNLLHRLKLQVNYRLLASLFDKTVAVSRDIQELLKRNFGFQQERVELICNGILVPETISHSGMKRDFVVGSAGRFFPVKDYPFMVQVANQVITRNRNIRFELAGDGPMLGIIQSLIKNYRLETHFILRGFLHDMSVFYQGIDVYLNTSLHEGLPMSVLEAMAYGLPVIVPKVGGLEEIVTDGMDGYLVDVRNPNYFADRCLSLYEDEILRLQMAHAAREKIIRDFSVQRMVQDYTDMYLKTIEMKGLSKTNKQFQC